MLVQIKRCIYIWKWETLDNENRYVPIRTQTERNKTGISGRNTLSQLH